MAKLDFTSVDETKTLNDIDAAQERSKKSPRRERIETVQMSVRMKEDVYAAFKALADKERRKNGEMLEVLIEHYLSSGAEPKFD